MILAVATIFGSALIVYLAVKVIVYYIKDFTGNE